MRTLLIIALVLAVSIPAAGTDRGGRGSFTILHTFEVTNPWSWGIGFDGTNFWITSGEPFSHADTTMFWIYDTSGTLVDSFIQVDGTHWGCRDLACDGTYMFGSEDGKIRAFDMSGNPAGWFWGPLIPNRGLAYDGTYFYCCNYDDAVYKIEWDGTWESPPLSVEPIIAAGPGFRYGLAYDTSMDCLWMTYADGVDVRVEKYDTEGNLLGTYTTWPQYSNPAGATMADTPYGYVLAVLHLDPGHADGADRVVLYDVSETAVESESWGRIKAQYR